MGRPKSGFRNVSYIVFKVQTVPPIGTPKRGHLRSPYEWARKRGNQRRRETKKGKPYEGNQEGGNQVRESKKGGIKYWNPIRFLMKASYFNELVPPYTKGVRRAFIKIYLINGLSLRNNVYLIA